MNRNVMLTCALTGAGDTVGRSELVPVTPEQIAESGIAAARAGATIIHIHVRDPETGVGSRDVALYREVVERVRASDVDVIVNTTAGMGGDLVLDPCCGSGTTLVAAELLGRRSLGIDVSKPALALARSRLGQPMRSESALLSKGREAYRAADAQLLAELGDALTDFARRSFVARGGAFEPDGRGGQQRAAALVGDDLGIHVLVAAEHTEARPLVGAAHATPHPLLPAPARHGLVESCHAAISRPRRPPCPPYGGSSRQRT